MTIDDLYTEPVSAARADSIIALLRRLQFPVFARCLKLTLLNHCLLLEAPQERDDAGRITIRVV